MRNGALRFQKWVLSTETSHGRHRPRNCLGWGSKHCRAHTRTAEFQACEEAVFEEMKEGETYRAAKPPKRCPVLWDNGQGHELGRIRQTGRFQTKFNPGCLSELPMELKKQTNPETKIGQPGPSLTLWKPPGDSEAESLWS